MKIAVISSSVFAVPVKGYAGLEHLAYLQAKGLAEKGHKVALVAPEGSTCEGCEIISTGPPGQWDEFYSFQRYLHRLPEFDVIVDNSWSKWSYHMKLTAGLKPPVLGVCHAPIDTMYRTLPDIEKPSFICISKDQALHFEALFNREAKVAYNGVDLDYYKSMNIPRSDRFLFLARFSTIKGADLAIEACLKAGVGLDLVGDTSITNEPEYFKKCEELAQQSSPGWNTVARGKQIRIIGGVSRSECVWWFSQAHALIHPNKRFREPFGLAPVEAMACGCPVIAWKYGAMKETVCEGETGLLCKTFDELVIHIGTLSKVLADTDRPRCRQWAHQFSIQNMIDRYEELCLEAVQTGGW